MKYLSVGNVAVLWIISESVTEIEQFLNEKSDGKFYTCRR